MKQIAIFTTTRAEFGLYLPLIREIESSIDLNYSLFVGGTHLAPEHGFTINEIEANNIKIEDTFDYIPNTDSFFAAAQSLGFATIQLANIFRNHKFDLVIILGDRIELLSIVQNAILFKKVIVHLNGGERTEGAMDEQIRHMVSKVSHLHFVSCQAYADNLSALGENSWRVHNVGSLAASNLTNMVILERKELFTRFELNPELETILMTYHPVTLENSISATDQILNVFKALNFFNYQVVITSPNVDNGREEIMNIILKEVASNPNYKFIQSLGFKYYHSLIFHCKFVLGNSSSGIIEVPYFKVPTINIGDRQKGRVRHESIIDTGYSATEIIKGIERAVSPIFLASLQNMKYLFGNGSTAKRIVNVLSKIEINQKLLRKSLDN